MFWGKFKNLFSYEKKNLQPLLYLLTSSFDVTRPIYIVLSSHTGNCDEKISPPACKTVDVRWYLLFHFNKSLEIGKMFPIAFNALGICRKKNYIGLFLRFLLLM